MAAVEATNIGNEALSKAATVQNSFRKKCLVAFIIILVMLAVIVTIIVTTKKLF